MNETSAALLFVIVEFLVVVTLSLFPTKENLAVLTSVLFIAFGSFMLSIPEGTK